MMIAISCVLLLALIYVGLKWAATVQNLEMDRRKSANDELILSNMKLERWNIDAENNTVTMDDKEDLAMHEGRKSIPLVVMYRHIDAESRSIVQDAIESVLHGEIDHVQFDYGFQPEGRAVEWFHGYLMVKLRNEQGKPMALTMVSQSIDIYHRQITQLQADKERLEQESKLKSEIIESVGREVRTPLNAIMGFTQLLNEAEDAEQRQSCMSIIEENNQALLQSMTNLMDYCRLRAGMVSLREEDMDVNAKLDELKDKFICQLPSQVMMYFTEKIEGCMLRTDIYRFSQIITVFLDNAVKYTAKGNICLGYRIQDDGLLYFYVSDTGCGIELAKQATLFEEHEPEDDSTIGNKGKCLGLLLCKAIVQKMGGEIGVKSQLGVGSEFWFTVPYNK